MTDNDFQDIEEEMASEEEPVDIGAVRYAGFKMRLYATTIDMLLTLPIVALFIPMTGDIPPEITEAAERAIQRVEEIGYSSISLFYKYLAEELWAIGYFTKAFWGMIIDIVIAGVVVVLFWHYKCATPGKMLLSMKIVDANTFEPPSTKQNITRYLGYIVSALPFMLGFLWIAFNKRKQAWHDKMANTVVIFTKPLDPDWKEKKFKRNTIIAITLVVLFLLYMGLK